MKLSWCATFLCLLSSTVAQEFNITAVLEQIKNELLNGIYTARVEVNVLKADKTSVTTKIVEYHDGKTGIHSIDISPPGIRKVFYANQQQMVATIDTKGECTTITAADAAKNKEPYFYEIRGVRNKNYFFGPSGVAASLQDLKLEGNAVVRGFDARVFKNGDVRVFFTTGKYFVLSRRNIPFPARVEITEGDSITQIDFYQVEDLSPKDISRLGDGLQLPPSKNGCKPPLTSSKPVPELKNHISFSTETSIGVTATEYFSFTDRLYRADVFDGVSVIHDDNLGITYTLGEQCTAQANDKAISTVLSSGSNNAGARVIQAYLSLNQKYFVGQSTVRGVPVDVWEAIGNDDIFKSARFFFAENEEIVSANSDETSGPVLMKAWLNYKDGDSTEVNIYDFFSSIDKFQFRNNFNIESCVESFTYVDIVYEADDPFNLEEFASSNALTELINITETAIRTTVFVSTLQLPVLKAEIVDDRHVQVFAKILSAPTYLNSFKEREGTYFHYPIKAIDSATEESCAQKCVDAMCATFLFCPGEAHCYLMNDQDSSKWGTEDKLSQKDCKAYDKSLNVKHINRQTLAEITDNLEMAINNGYEVFKQEVMSASGKVLLRASEFFAHLSQFNRQGSLGPYEYQVSRKSLNPDDISSFQVPNVVETAAGCYRECRINKDISCSSFSICTSSKKCLLTSLNINEGTRNDDSRNTVLDATEDCTIYSVNYLSEFEKLAGKSRKSGSIENSNAQTAGDCALTCRQTDQPELEDCRSFDFCPKSGKCFFYRTHFNWDGGNDALKDTEECDHYALRYSASYIAIGKGIYSASAKEVGSVTFEDCAKQCSEMSDEKCKTISFCDTEGKTTCIMYDVNPENAQIKTVDNKCTIYAKDALIFDEIINPSRQSEAEKMTSTSGMSNGAFSGLLVAMLLVGIAIGVVAFLQQDKILSIAGRMRNRASPETTISYNKQENDAANLEI